MAELQDWLEDRFTAVLDAGGQSGLVLEAELTALVQELGAGQAGIEEAMRLGQATMAEQMRMALAEVVERVTAAGSQLEELHLTGQEIRADVRKLLTLTQPTAPSGRQIEIGRMPPTADCFQDREVAATLRAVAEQGGTMEPVPT